MAIRAAFSGHLFVQYLSAIVTAPSLDKAYPDAAHFRQALNDCNSLRKKISDVTCKPPQIHD